MTEGTLNFWGGLLAFVSSVARARGRGRWRTNCDSGSNFLRAVWW